MRDVLILLALVLLVAAPAHAADPWRWPLRGAVVTPFHLAANPFAPGQHRGVDIAAEPGAQVHSACPGRVRFAGRLADRGRVVSVECGTFVATYLELGSVSVRRGQRVLRGAPIGTVAASHLQLGARRAGNPNGYVDPLTLLGDPTRSPPPLGAAPTRSTPRWSPQPQPRPRPRSEEREHRPSTAWPVWAGLGLLLAGAPAGALWRCRRTRGITARAAREHA